MIDRSEVIIRYSRGTGPGGQHKNKTESCVELTHVPTGITVREDGRKRHQNEKIAFKELNRRVNKRADDFNAAIRKQRREHAIRNETRVRTYNFTSGVVTDHRSNKTASIKSVLVKGQIDKLR
jgi:peptide chain release factor 1